MNVSFDSPELESLFSDFVAAPAKLRVAVRAVVVKGAVNVKADARARFVEQQGSSRLRGYLPRYASSITFDVAEVGSDEVSAEIGPTVSAGNQGAFGPGIEFGSVRHAPMPHLMPALDAEEPKLLLALETVIGDVLL
jgi:hypothetical protein